MPSGFCIFREYIGCMFRLFSTIMRTRNMEGGKKKKEAEILKQSLASRILDLKKKVTTLWKLL